MIHMYFSTRSDVKEGAKDTVDFAYAINFPGGSAATNIPTDPKVVARTSEVYAVRPPTCSFKSAFWTNASH